MLVVENKHLEMVIAGDGHPELVSEEVEDGHLVGAEDGQLEVGDRHLDQSMHLELLPQATYYPYSWHMVIAGDGQLVVLVVEDRLVEMVVAVQAQVDQQVPLDEAELFPQLNQS